MHRARKLLGEDLVDGALCGHAALPEKGIGADVDAEMGLSALPVSGMAAMRLTVIHNLKMGWLKGIGKLAFNPVAYTHSLPLFRDKLSLGLSRS